MALNVLGLTQNGLRDWLTQRVSAIILGLYFIYLLGFIVMHPDMPFYVWHDLFSCLAMKIFSFLALLSLIFHAWVGVWTIITDYINSPSLRLSLMVLVIVSLFSMLALGSKIVWSV
ncbi:MAG: succinate dehydrogenase, hydrophobic membrane anchor protein [Gammaproteobacteria bacterium]